MVSAYYKFAMKQYCCIPSIVNFQQLWQALKAATIMPSDSRATYSISTDYGTLYDLASARVKPFELMQQLGPICSSEMLLMWTALLPCAPR